MTILTLDAAVPFEIFENAGLLFYFGAYEESGYALTSSRSDEIKFITWDETWGKLEGFYYNGAGLLANPAYESVTLTDATGGTFALRSIDLDTQWERWGDIDVTFYGTTAAGVVTYTVTLDNSEGLQTVTLPDSFWQVSEVTWLAEGPSNIHFNDVAVSAPSDDVVRGTADNDKMKGKAGDDLMSGLAGNDALKGGKGDDTLAGGAGEDKLTGGKGADLFVFGDGDTITDFKAAQGDRIDLSTIDANPALSGNQAFRFLGDAAFDHAAAALRFENGILMADLDGDGAADMDITLSGVRSLAEGDLLL